MFIDIFKTKKQYQVIYADPPWQIGGWKETGWRAPHGNAFGQEHYYKTLPLEDIKALKIPATDNSWLILWATATRLPEALEVMKAWGFEYRTCAIWDKWHLGLGWFFRIQHEILLIGRRGNPAYPAIKVRSIFNEKRTIHAKKPQCVRTWLEQAFLDCSKLELFAREKVAGWDSWGDEIGGKNERKDS